MKKVRCFCRHSREGGNPDPLPNIVRFQPPNWIPAFAGMTDFSS